MRNKKQDQKIALHLLQSRSHGFSIASVIRKRAMAFIFQLVLVALCVYEFLITRDSMVKILCAYMGGLFLGGVLRDFGWLRKSKQQWPLMESLLDWKKVETLANDGEAQPTAAASPSVDR